MNVLSEIELRREIRDPQSLSTYRVSADTLVTPSARSYLSENRIKLVLENGLPDEDETDYATREQEAETSASDKKDNLGKFFLLDAQIKTEYKPETYTHLNGNNLVPKNHPRIKFRGKLDSLEARIIVAQVMADKAGYTDIVENLSSILDAVRKLLRAEVLSEEYVPEKIMGQTEEEIHDMSHNPREMLGVGHFMPSWKMGEMMATLNILRTDIRETEIAACEAFTDPQGGFTRMDIIQAFNRLSSAMYVVMCRLRNLEKSKQ